MFTDESSFTTGSTKNRTHIWRRKGRRLLLKHIIPAFKSAYKTVSVSGGFFTVGRTPIAGTIGSFNSDTHCVIIDDHMFPFVHNKHGGLKNFVLREDYCNQNRAKSIATYPDREYIRKSGTHDFFRNKMQYKISKEFVERLLENG